MQERLIKEETLWIFVVDTNQYAGNFERDMTAFVTGVWGDCEVGKKTANDFKEQHPEYLDVRKFSIFWDMMVQVPDENGCKRPCSLWDNPKWFNDGLGHFYKRNSYNVTEVTKKYLESWVAMKEKYGDKYSEDDLAKQKWVKCPAYLSVAMFFREQPSLDDFNFLCKRVNKFVAEKPSCLYFDFLKVDNQFVIENFRIIKKVVRTFQTELLSVSDS